MVSVRYAFRDQFKPVLKESLQWYPGHMEKSFTKMQAKIKQVDCILEVHDARIPLSGRNPNFVRRLIGPKPHILVLNKKDLVEKKTASVIEKQIKSEVENVVFTNCKDQMCRGLKQVVPKAVDLVNNSDRFNRSEERKLRMMVIGVPNVGKSSLINALRNRIFHKGRANAVGAIAGVTRAVQNEVKINANPAVYLVDTPGILPPRVQDVETGMKLALCSCLNDDVVGVEQIADFLLYWCNRHHIFTYLDVFKMDEPSDNIIQVLSHIAKQENRYKRRKDVATNTQVEVLDVHYAAFEMVRAFRQGKLGLHSLDFPTVLYSQ